MYTVKVADFQPVSRVPWVANFYNKLIWIISWIGQAEQNRNLRYQAPYLMMRRKMRHRAIESFTSWSVLFDRVNNFFVCLCCLIMEWTKEVLSDLIEMYRDKPCLWKLRDKTYFNKNLKRQGYEEIVEFLQTKTLQTITVKDVKTKIQNIRNAFRKETKKIEDSKRSSTGSDDIYKPNLWYYNLLLFTKDQDVPLESLNSIKTEDSEFFENTEQINNDEDSIDKMLECTLTESSEMSTQSSSSTKLTQESIFKQSTSRSNKRKYDYDPYVRDFMKACTKTLASPDRLDEFDNICTSFAAKMRKMETRQQIFAEALMHKIITQGLLGQLNEYIDVIDRRNIVGISKQTYTNFPQYNSRISTPLAPQLDDESS